MRQNPKGRQAKSKARIARFNDLASYEHQQRNETNEIFIPVAERLGDAVIEFENVRKALRRQAPDRRPVVPHSGRRHRRHHRAQRRGQDDAVPHDHRQGEARRRQDHDRPHRAAGGRRPDARIAAQRQDRVGGDQQRPGHPHRRPLRDAVARVPRPLQLQGPDQQKIVGQLSGGERGRLHLAATLLKGGNVLLLDEPSNDLDVETLRALEEALLEFAGSALVISHDRWFLDRIATHILAAEGDSQWYVLPRQLPRLRGRQEEAPRRGSRASRTVSATSR